jgi:hypothetical protein
LIRSVSEVTAADVPDIGTVTVGDA